MGKKILFLIVLAGFTALNMATIRRSEDPVRDTQTNPILYKQKMEEEKDGKKGPLAYSVKNNPSDDFLTAPPFVPKNQEKGTKKEETRSKGTDWWEESVASDQAVPADKLPQEQEAVIPDQGSAPSAGSAWEEKTEERTPAAEPAGKEPQEPSSASSGKADDFWW